MDSDIHCQYCQGDQEFLNEGSCLTATDLLLGNTLGFTRGIKGQACEIASYSRTASVKAQQRLAEKQLKHIHGDGIGSEGW